MPQFKQNKKRIDPRYFLHEAVGGGKCSKDWAVERDGVAQTIPHTIAPNTALGYISAYIKNRSTDAKGKMNLKLRSDLEFKFMTAQQELDALRKNPGSKPTDKLALWILQRILTLEKKAQQEYQFIGECLRIN